MDRDQFLEMIMGPSSDSYTPVRDIEGSYASYGPPSVGGYSPGPAQSYSSGSGGGGGLLSLLGAGLGSAVNEMMNPDPAMEAQAAQSASAYNQASRFEARGQEVPQVRGGYEDVPRIQGGYSDVPKIQGGYSDVPKIQGGYSDVRKIQGGYEDIQPRASLNTSRTVTNSQQAVNKSVDNSVDRIDPTKNYPEAQRWASDFSRSLLNDAQSTVYSPQSTVQSPQSKISGTANSTLKTNTQKVQTAQAQTAKVQAQTPQPSIWDNLQAGWNSFTQKAGEVWNDFNKSTEKYFTEKYTPQGLATNLASGILGAGAIAALPALGAGAATAAASNVIPFATAKAALGSTAAKVAAGAATGGATILPFVRAAGAESSTPKISGGYSDTPKISGGYSNSALTGKTVSGWNPSTATYSGLGVSKSGGLSFGTKATGTSLKPAGKTGTGSW